MKIALVKEYNPDWPKWFETIRSFLEPALTGVPHTVEHVGSTSIPGMVAKPIIDIIVVVEKRALAVVQDRLASIGYIHEGNLGIQDREAFDLRDTAARETLPSHHLYVAMTGSQALRDHLAFRDFMKTHPEWVTRLSMHKKALCAKYNNDREAYTNGKAELVREITMIALKEVPNLRL